jgi:hypothetical protein
MNFSNRQVGKEMRSIEDLIDCQEESNGNSYCQVGNEMGPVDLIVCQVSRREIPNCQVGKGIKMRLFKSLKSLEESSYQ